LGGRLTPPQSLGKGINSSMPWLRPYRDSSPKWHHSAVNMYSNISTKPLNQGQYKIILKQGSNEKNQERTGCKATWAQTESANTKTIIVSPQQHTALDH
jgi:hypothetical protein